MTGEVTLRADVVRIVAHALRVATGDLTIRPHHLRHSAATNSYGLLVVDGMPVHKVCLSNRGIAWQSTVNINCPVCIGSKPLCLGRQW